MFKAVIVSDLSPTTVALLGSIMIYNVMRFYLEYLERVSITPLSQIQDIRKEVDSIMDTNTELQVAVGELRTDIQSIREDIKDIKDQVAGARIASGIRELKR
jgi:regulator of replication initiation timing